MEWILKMIEINKIMLICIVHPGQVINYKVMMDIQRKIIDVIVIILQVVKMNISKQQQ